MLYASPTQNHYKTHAPNLPESRTNPIVSCSLQVAQSESELRKLRESCEHGSSLDYRGAIGFALERFLWGSWLARFHTGFIGLHKELVWLGVVCYSESEVRL